MRDLKGKTAFITGGASGIGLAMARSFGRAGMNIMLADIEAGPLQAAVEALGAQQVRADGLVLDVSDRAAVEAAAARTVETFGKVHVVCNNAGVGVGGPVGSVSRQDWEWILSVNVMGVINGLDAFLPHVRAHGEGGHFVNTASMGGLVSLPGMEPYSASKYAVVAMSEGWVAQLAPENIGVSVLCPGFVKTALDRSGRARPDKFGGPKTEAMGSSFIQAGIDPQWVGERVLEAVEANELYIITHPDMRASVEDRFARIMAGFDSAAASPALKGVEYQPAAVVGLFS